MLALMAVAFFTLAWLFGNALIVTLDSKRAWQEYHLEDRVMAGFFVLIGLAEGAYLGALARGQSVSAFIKYYVILLAATCLISCMIGSFFAWKQKKRGAEGFLRSWKQKKCGAEGFLCSWKQKPQRWEIIVIASVFVIAFIQLLGILVQTRAFLEYDETMETVVSFLYTNRFYEVDPLTGVAYQQGMPARLKILCLPAIYTFLVKTFHVTAEQVTWHAFPAIVLVASYLAYFSLARSLFPEKRFQRWLFMLLFSILIFASDSAYGAEGFGLLHGGFQGVTIRGAVMMPWLFGLCIRRKWRLVPLVILAEVCIVWTMYGLGMCVLVTGMFLICLQGRKLLRKQEETKCENS